MTEEEKRFKIKKIERYDELVGKEVEKIIYSTIITCIAGASCISIAAHDLTNFASNDIALMSGLGASFFTFGLNRMISAISKKTNYDLERNKEQFDLDYEEDKSRGGR